MNEGGTAPHPLKGMIKMAKVSYTAATLAAELEVAPKALRVFLRTPDSGIAPVGKGGRYSLEMTATQLTKFKKNFAAWTEAREAARAARQAEVDAAALAATPAELDMTAEGEEIIEVDSPTYDELDAAAFDEMILEVANEDDEVDEELTDDEVDEA